jgi:hypothetical protein
MFKGIYDKAVQSMTVTWAEYLDKNGDTGRLFREEFTSNMYTIAGALLILLTLSSCLIYYYYFNGKFGNYYRWYHWLYAMSINAVLVGMLTMIIGFSLYKKLVCPTGHHVAMLGLLNLLYAALLFFFLSFIFKWKSVMGKTTPF